LKTTFHDEELVKLQTYESIAHDPIPEWGSCRVQVSAAEIEVKKRLPGTGSSGGPERCSARSPRSTWERLQRVTHFSANTDATRCHHKRQITSHFLKQKQ